MLTNRHPVSDNLKKFIIQLLLFNQLKFIKKNTRINGNFALKTTRGGEGFPRDQCSELSNVIE